MLKIKIGLSIKEVNPIDPVSDTKETNNEQPDISEEGVPTEHKEDLSGTIGEAIKNNINLQE